MDAVVPERGQRLTLAALHLGRRLPVQGLRATATACAMLFPWVEGKEPLCLYGRAVGFTFGQIEMVAGRCAGP